MSIIDEITREFRNKEIPDFKAGDTVRVYMRIKEGEKERVQFFEGIVIAIHRNGISTTFKVRKESFGVGVEKTFPLYSPLIEKIEVKRRGDVRRAKLYYLRKLSGKKARVKEKKEWMIKKKEEAKRAQQEAQAEAPAAEEVSLPEEGVSSVEAEETVPSSEETSQAKEEVSPEETEKAGEQASGEAVKEEPSDSDEKE
ncbi:MAG: 50S ribosomal protein L19 [Deltaproteobacteria bacterium]|nr:MAG: 50S ribosomal protein L19 [Deltaproteobacteria bacterium]